MAEKMEIATTIQVRLFPTPEQAALLHAHCQEYIGTINVLVQALDAGVVPDGGHEATTKDFTAALPSAVKNQALRDARAVWKRSFALGRIPVLRKPLCQWNNQNWRLEGEHLVLPTWQPGAARQMSLRCAAVAVEGASRDDVQPVTLRCGAKEWAGKRGLLRITRKRGKWMADLTLILPAPEPTPAQGVMGVDLGVKVPAVVHVIGKGQRFFGKGRAQRMMRRRFYARRRQLQKAGKVRARRQSQGKERRWMRDSNHKLSRQIVTHAQQQAVGVIRLEHLAGIRQRTARTSRGANPAKRPKARQNNRLIATWAFFQLATFIAYKAQRVGVIVAWVDPAHTSQLCPICQWKNTATDRRYVCQNPECGWVGHRDAVGAINISRRTGLAGNRRGATVA